MIITTTWHPSGSGNTIWERLGAKLGREPTNAEAADEVRRILDDATVERAPQGKLPHQRKGR